MRPVKVAIVPMLLTKERAAIDSVWQRYMVPLGPLYLARYLESLDLDLDIVVHDDIEKIVEFSPDIVGLSCVSENFGYAQEYAKLLKEKVGSLVVIGGAHITALPYYLPDCFDLGVVGEGELVFEQIIRTYLEKGADVTAYSSLLGVCFNRDGKTQVNERAKQIADVNMLPVLDRKKWVKQIGMPHVMTTRGCVFKCFFCAEPNIFKSFRQFSPERVVQEVEILLDQFPSTTHVRFYDDIFPLNKKRLEEMCKLLEERGLSQKLSFSGFVHTRLVDEDVVKLLKRMNFSYVMFGAESGSPELLKKIKPECTIEQSQKVIDWCEDYEMRVSPTFIIGTPTETVEDLKLTYSFIERNKRKIFDAEINPAVALPGTQLFEDALKQGVIPLPEKMDWTRFKDQAHLKSFDFDQYIYLAENIKPKIFVNYLNKLWQLSEEIRYINKSSDFYFKNGMGGFLPVAFN